jgi:hypothetical protein
LKWVQQKGLGNGIGLQDAYKLAKDMLVIDVDDKQKAENEDTCFNGARSCAASSGTIYAAWDTPLSPHRLH